MNWCEAEEPRGVSLARRGKCGGTCQLKPPTEQIISPNLVTFTYLSYLPDELIIWWGEFVLQEKRVLFIVTVSLVNLYSFLACCSLGLNGPSSAVTNSSLLGGEWEVGQATVFPRSLWFERVNFWLAWWLSSVTIYGCFRQHKVVFQDLPSGYGLCPCTVLSWDPRAAYSSFFFCKGVSKTWCLIISRV